MARDAGCELCGGGREAMTELEQVNAYIDKIAQIPALELSEAQLYLLALHDERNRLQKEVEAANECIEDVCCGTRPENLV